MFCTFWSNSTVLSSDSSGEKHSHPDMGKPEEECESADPGSKGTMAPPPPPRRGIAVDTSTATVPGDDLVTIVSAPLLASAEHVSFLFFVFCCRVRASAPDGSSPRVYMRLFIVGYRLKPLSLILSCALCMIRCAPALPMGVAPESMCGLAQSGMDSESGV